MKIALFFGTFNPIHVGHLIIANNIQQTQGLDQVWYVVTPHNPHKDKTTLLPDFHRLNMVRLAIDEVYHFKASDVEFSLSQPNYTVNTLAKLKEMHPNHEFSLILGEDNLRGLHKWYNYEYILENHRLLVYSRVLTAQEIEQNAKNELQHDIKNHKNVIFLKDVPLLKISSSYIRNQISKGFDVRFLLSEPVYQYVDEMNFYK
jgi:nicotinate-nucleotide adenylyltransferase